MRIEVWKGEGKQPWHWHFKHRNGRIVADAEAFPTKAHAIRAGKAVVKAILGGNPGFYTAERGHLTVVTWN